MAAAGRKDQNKAGKSFDTGSMNALLNVDLASGIFEAPGAIQPEAQKTKPVSVAGGPLDKLCGSTANEEQKSTSGTQETVNSNMGIGRKLKDTAGASAMIL